MNTQKCSSCKKLLDKRARGKTGKCLSCWRKTHKDTLETKNKRNSKISHSKLGHFVSDVQKQNQRKKMLGRKATEKHKEKISKKLTEFYSSPKGVNLKKKFSLDRTGKYHSDDTKRKIGDSQRQEKNHAWMGGISLQGYGTEFNNILREKIRFRDSYCCQKCFLHQSKLGRKPDIHHIDYNKKNNKPENLISLCRTCHSQTNFNRNYWKDYYKESRRITISGVTYEKR